jgi:hypothetical protein
MHLRWAWGYMFFFPMKKFSTAENLFLAFKTKLNFIVSTAAHPPFYSRFKYHSYFKTQFCIN